MNIRSWVDGSFISPGHGMSESGGGAGVVIAVGAQTRTASIVLNSCFGPVEAEVAAIEAAIHIATSIADSDRMSRLGIDLSIYTDSQSALAYSVNAISGCGEALRVGKAATRNRLMSRLDSIRRLSKGFASVSIQKCQSKGCADSRIAHRLAYSAAMKSQAARSAGKQCREGAEP